MLALLATVAAADPRSDAQKRFYIGAKAYHANNFAAAAEHFEEAYKILPLPEIAFSAAQSYRRQYRIDRKIERAQRAVDLYRLYLDAVKTGGQVGIAADGLDAMERELQKVGGTKSVTAPVVQRTTIIINPQLAAERMQGDDGFELSEAPDDTAKIVALLDGKPVPVYEKLDVEPGPHKIHVEVEGYMPADATERAVKDSNTTANMKLEPRPAKVTVKTETGVHLRVDGRPATGPDLALPAGRHVIAITKKGRESVAREVIVRRGEVITINEPLEKTTRRKAVPWVATGAGVLAIISTATLITALVYDDRAADKLSSFENQGDKSPADVADYNTLVQRRDRLSTGAWVTGGGALLLGTAALALYFFDSPGDAEVRVAPAASASGGGVTVFGRF
ncbi:MAG: hypothetical protein M4D80_17300 [Myxococcota bacterium]|nr:hypothetical protein [Myxococcota bacterium]